jgi:ariadne-1
MANWRGHSACNVHGIKKVKNMEKAFHEAKKNLAKSEKFLFHFDRYNAHIYAVNFVNKSRQKWYEKIHTMNVALSSINSMGEGLPQNMDVGYIMHAFDTITQCRRVLAFSYIYAYSLLFDKRVHNSMRKLFQFHQANLEKFTDELQGMIESDMQSLLTGDYRKKTISHTRMVTDFRENVIDAIQKNRDL